MSDARAVPRYVVLGGCAVAAVGLAGWMMQTPPESSAAVVTLNAAATTTVDQPVQSDRVAALFANQCAMCHGPTGAGDGPAAYLLSPRPRDFTTGIFRFKSTLEPQPPTLDDLTRTISNGIARTGMPGFGGVLTDAEVAALAEYVLKLGGITPDAAAAVPISIPKRPNFDDAFVEAGRRVYVTMGCGLCHGETGRGDGPSSSTLVDANGYPLPPADFTTGVFKAGSTPEDLYRTLMVGVPGTPMPSYKDALEANIPIEGVGTETDRAWAIVAYLESLQQPREREGVRSDAVIHANRASFDSLLSDPFRSAWDSQSWTPISVQPLWQRKVAARAVEVRAFRDDRRVMICLEWPDPTFDAEETMSRATDGSALMFSLSNEPVSLTMGLLGSGSQEPLVNLWHWKASRQVDADEGRRRDGLDDADPSADLYMFKSGDPVAGGLEEHDETFITAAAVGNVAADPRLMLRPVLESNAAGFSTMTPQPVEQQHVEGRGEWSDGKWRVVFVRDLEGGEDDADFGIRRVPFCIAIWDGSASDRNGTKLISGWHWLELDE